MPERRRINFSQYRDIFIIPVIKYNYQAGFWHKVAKSRKKNQELSAFQNLGIGSNELPRRGAVARE